MPTWPGTLPQNLDAEGYTEDLPDNLIRTQMDVGPAKVRRRTQANVANIRGRLTLTTAEWSTLEGFYLADTAGGSLAFDWGSDSLRFTAPPSRAPLGATHWYVSLQFERLP